MINDVDHSGSGKHTRERTRAAPQPHLLNGAHLLNWLEWGGRIRNVAGAPAAGVRPPLACLTNPVGRAGEIDYRDFLAIMTDSIVKLAEAAEQHKQHMVRATGMGCWADRQVCPVPLGSSQGHK